MAKAYDPPPITGYRQLSAEEVELINAVKDFGDMTGKVCEKLEEGGIHDQRWISIGRTHLQQGFMALIRAITKPTSF